MQEYTGTLANGQRYRVTPYMLEVTDASGAVIHTVDVNDVKRVKREGPRVTIEMHKRKPNVALEAASIDDAGRIEASLNASPALAAPVQPVKSGGGFGRFMKWGCLGTIGVIVLIVIIAVAANGGGDDKPDTAVGSSSGNTAASTAKVGNDDEDVHAPLTTGSLAEIMAIKDRPAKVTITEIMDPAKSNNEFLKPADGKKWYALNVIVEATGEKAVTAGAWKMRDKDGFEYERAFVTGAGENLDFNEIAAGGKKQGLVVFEIPDGAEPEWVRFDPNVIVDGDLYFDAQ